MALHSHGYFRWQIRTSWFGFPWGVSALLAMLVLLGWFALVADSIWIVFRLVKDSLYSMTADQCTPPKEMKGP